MDFSIINISLGELCGLGAIVFLVVVQSIYSLRRKFCLSNWLKRKRFSPDDVAEQPPVSVVVFANRENGEGLKECVHAIMNQCYSEFEVIVVNADKISASKPSTLNDSAGAYSSLKYLKPLSLDCSDFTTTNLYFFMTLIV